MGQMRLFLALLVPLAACGGGPSEPDLRIVAGPILASAIGQVRRCYQTPRVGRSARQIVTVIRVRLTREGHPDGLPTVLAQQGVTPENRPFAGRMAEAAIGAVMRCAPLRLPAETYEVWREIDLTFSPRASA